MNKVILLGRFTKEPDIRFTQTNNTKVANFTLAVSRAYVRQGEERQTDFINIVTFGKTAEFVEKYISKGQQIAICGRIQTRTYTDNNEQTRYITEVIAEEVYFADSNKKNEPDANLLNGKQQDNTEIATNENTEDLGISGNNDDLPF